MEVIKILIKDLLSQLAHMFQTCLLLLLFLLLLVQLFYFFTPSSPNTRSKYSSPPSSTNITSEITAGSDDQASSSSSANTSEITAGSDDQASSSSATVNPAAPQLPSTNFRYDVFVSFRGEDSRRTITRSLVKSLKEQAGVDAFFDEDDLKKGEKIEVLFEAIRNSHMFVLVISENYGNSRWCMKELQEIVNTGRTFIPVFYSVDPKDVRHQTGAFGEAFFNGDAMREGGRSIAGFTKALTDVGSTSGHVLDKEDDRNRDEVIRLIVEQVQETIKKPPFIPPKYVVGINERVLKIKMLFKDHKMGAQMIGIYGMGGIGKTTVVLGVYNDVYRSFTASTVLENVREGIEKNGLCFMQEKLLHGLAINDKTTDDVEIGKSILKRRFSKKKVLIVLDDIDNTDQLKALVGETDWFGNGSKILITTRDKDVLDGHGVVDTFDVNKLEEDESLSLLSHHAFGMAKPPVQFLSLCEDVLRIASGLPLVIEVYGCCLKDQYSGQEWKRFLRVASGVSSSNIFTRLEISLQGLHQKERSMFLDIACLFVGCHKEIVIELWGDNKRIDGSLTIDKLVKRSLLKVGDDNILKMHDMIRDMARDTIERDAEKSVSCVPSRIWESNVARKVMQRKKDFERVEGMNLNIGEVFPKGKSVLRSLDPMQNLRILQIEGTCSSDDDQSLRLPENLELLDWKRCSISWIPSFWDLSNIVILNLSRSSLETWSPEQMLKRLRLLDLNHCCKLKSVENFENTPNLVKLVLDGCTQLSQMDDSIGDHLKRLTSLGMDDCHTIAQLPGSIGGLAMLKELSLRHCFALKSLPDSIGKARLLKKLDMYRCTSVEALPNTIGSLSNLEWLNLNYTSSLQHVPKSIGNLMNLKKFFMFGTAVRQLPPSLASLEKLVELDVSGNQQVSKIPENIFGSLTNLRKLELAESSHHVEVLPEDMCNLSSLEVLSLKLNKELKSVPERLGDLRCLTELILTATSIQTLPDSITLLENLHTLDLGNCRKLQSLPDSIGKLTALRTFNLYCTSELLELPSSVGELRSLTRLDLGRSGIESLPKSIGCLEKLRELDLSFCRKLTVLPCVSELKELRMVSVYGSGIKEIEESKQLPLQIIAAMRSAAERSKEFSTVFMSMYRSGGEKRVNVVSSSRLTEKLVIRVKEQLVLRMGSLIASDDGKWLSRDSSSSRADYINNYRAGVNVVSSSRLKEKLVISGKELGLIMGSLIASDDGEWLSRDSSSRADYINNDCNIIILIFSKPYLQSEECLEELEAIVESVKNNDQLQIVQVDNDIDESTIYNMAARDSRWRNAVDVIMVKADTYLDSREFSTAEVLEDAIVDSVMCNLEKIMGTPIIPLLN